MHNSFDHGVPTSYSSADYLGAVMVRRGSLLYLDGGGRPCKNEPTTATGPRGVLHANLSCEIVNFRLLDILAYSKLFSRIVDQSYLIPASWLHSWRYNSRNRITNCRLHVMQGEILAVSHVKTLRAP
jgi:hypothetical protein